MRFLLLILSLCIASPALAQLMVPLGMPDGKVGCFPGQTGIGRPSVWTSVADPEAHGGWALAETGGDATDLRFPLCVSPEAGSRDFDASLRFKPVSGTRDKAAGLIFRAQNGSDYYVVKASALDNTVRLYRMLGGRRMQLASKEIEVKTGQWQTLRVAALVDRIEAWLDDKPLFGVNDRSLMHPGAIGVWSQADSLTYYGLLLVTPMTP